MDLLEGSNPYLRRLGHPLLWPSWRRAIGAAARANASLYVVSVTGTAQPFDVSDDDLVVATGGADLVHSNDFIRAVDLIWEHTATTTCSATRPRRSHAICTTSRSRSDVPGVALTRRGRGD